MAGSGFDNDVMYADNVNFAGVNVGGQRQAQMIADGQLIIGDAAGNPQINTLTAGAGVAIVNAAGSITISASAAPIVWQDLAPGALAISNGYFATGAGIYSLPVGAADGETIEIVDQIGGGVAVLATAGQSIQISNSLTAVARTATSTLSGDGLRLKFRLSNLTWVSVPGVAGNWLLT